MAFVAEYNLPKPQAFLSPVAVAVFPKLNKPSTKFNPDGVYEARIRLSEEQAAPISAKIKAMEAETLTALVADMKAKGKFKGPVKQADHPVKAEYDKEGNPTGFYTMKFTMKALTKKGPQKPQVVDAKKNPSQAEVWGGSKIKVAGLLAPFYSPSLGCGVSLKLRAVQIIELVTGSGSAGADMFDAEHGYSADDEEPVVFTETAADAPVSAAKVDASAF